MTKAASNYSELCKLTEEKNSCETELEEKFARWEYLEDLSNRIKSGE